MSTQADDGRQDDGRQDENEQQPAPGPLALWVCQEPGCHTNVSGVGDGAGLLAIGWHFQRGQCGVPPVIRCAYHHPEGILYAIEQATTMQKAWGADPSDQMGDFRDDDTTES